MKKKSSEKLVTRNAGEIPPPTSADLERLEKACRGPVDTSDMPEVTPEQFAEAIKRRRARLRRISKVA